MITRCAHYEDGRPIPCPPQCPAQCWPAFMFRRTLLGRWRLRRKHIGVWAHAEAERTQPPVCDRESCYEGSDEEVNRSRFEHSCIPDWIRLR